MGRVKFSMKGNTSRRQPFTKADMKSVVKRVQKTRTTNIRGKVR